MWIDERLTNDGQQCLLRQFEIPCEVRRETAQVSIEEPRCLPRDLSNGFDDQHPGNMVDRMVKEHRIGEIDQKPPHPDHPSGQYPVRSGSPHRHGALTDVSEGRGCPNSRVDFRAQDGEIALSTRNHTIAMPESDTRFHGG